MRAVSFPGGEAVDGFVQTPGNPNWLGEAGTDEIAAQICRAAGPSGTNAEYVLELARALQDTGGDDPHVREPARRIASPVAGRGEPAGPRAGKRDVAGPGERRRNEREGAGRQEENAAAARSGSGGGRQL